MCQKFSSLHCLAVQVPSQYDLSNNAKYQKQISFSQKPVLPSDRKIQTRNMCMLKKNFTELFISRINACISHFPVTVDFQAIMHIRNQCDYIQRKTELSYNIQDSAVRVESML